jgi:hypothetical protein
MTDRTAIDAGLLGAASGALGAARLAGLLVVLEARLASLSETFIAGRGDHAALLWTLHQSRGSAASLGFRRLERALADAERRLALEAAEGACPSDAWGSDAPGLGRAIMEAWQVSLAGAALQIPELRLHRPFGRST